ncbi:cytochrome P450 4C1 [Solenopsis invicta]|uniref:cytochrome P450 4C1 n=1 Tax=Solenopsis invicta TaxID=13686 RepID=UPI0005960967|nr:cytochrome P450 4C1 [Solenopsis invicta]XP_011169812.1 cytochrome P450 4C1 [Solenopsis invicta]
MDFISLALFTLCVIVIFRVLLMVHYQYVVRQKLKNVPQVDSFPFGSTLETISMPPEERLKMDLKNMEKTCKEGIYIQWMGGKPFIAVFKPEYLERILPSTVNISKGSHYDMLESWLGKGLLISTGKQWFHDRKLIGTTFHFSILEKFAVVMTEKAQILIKILQKKMDENPGKPIDIFPLLINATLDVICETAMGMDLRAQEVQSKYTTAVQEIAELIIKRAYQPWVWADWIYYLTPAGRQYKSALKIVHGFANEVIEKKKRERQSKTNDTELENNDEFDIGKKKRVAFLDLLLEQNSKDDTPMTDEELRSQVDTIMFAGHDTTSAAISWTLFLLGNNLEHQEKVHQELEEVFGDSDAPASVKQLPQLKYLDRVIKETLRIFPSAPGISRELVEDVQLDDITIPKDHSVLVQILLTHRNPEVWPDPLKFDPDRFLPENAKDRSPYAYIPFSAGPRNCIGMRFAQQEQKLLLVAILRKWRVKSVKTLDTIRYGDFIVLRPSEELLIHFIPKK